MCEMLGYIFGSLRSSELDRREQNKKIKELSNEIKELKRSEGE